MYISIEIHLSPPFVLHQKLLKFYIGLKFWRDSRAPLVSKVTKSGLTIKHVLQSVLSNKLVLAFQAEHSEDGRKFEWIGHRIIKHFPRPSCTNLKRRTTENNYLRTFNFYCLGSSEQRQLERLVVMVLKRKA